MIMPACLRNAVSFASRADLRRNLEEYLTDAHVGSCIEYGDFDTKHLDSEFGDLACQLTA